MKQRCNNRRSLIAQHTNGFSSPHARVQEFALGNGLLLSSTCDTAHKRPETTDWQHPIDLLADMWMC